MVNGLKCIMCRDERVSKWVKENREKSRAFKEKYASTNKEKIKRRMDAFRAENKDKILKRQRDLYPKWKEYYKIYGKQWRENNRERFNKAIRDRRARDINLRIMSNMRCRIYKAIANRSKSKGTENLLGCSISDFRDHIQSKFLTGMSFENYGQWQIDHIFPCALFDLSNPIEQKVCFNFRNCQPLWRGKNAAKGKRVADADFLKQLRTLVLSR